MFGPVSSSWQCGTRGPGQSRLSMIVMTCCWWVMLEPKFELSESIAVGLVLMRQMTIMLLFMMAIKFTYLLFLAQYAIRACHAYTTSMTSMIVQQKMKIDTWHNRQGHNFGLKSGDQAHTSALRIETLKALRGWNGKGDTPSPLD